MKPHRLLILPALLAALSGCGSIGEGSTLKSLEILPANGSEATSPYTLYECLRDQLVVIATFSDGTRADFSYRATWASSDPAVVEVSNNDKPSVFVIDGVFTELANTPYRPGTLIPRAGSGTVTITASFLGLSDSIDVAVSDAPISIAPVAPGVDPDAPPAVTYVGESTTQRYTLFAQQGNRLATLATINQLGNLTPVLWRFAGGQLDLGDDSVSGDFDKFAVPNASSPSAVIHTTTGVVTGKQTDGTAYTVQAMTDLCDNDPSTEPDKIATSQIQVAPVLGITLQHEPDFNGPGVTNGDFISGTSELLRVSANLDTDGDSNADVAQDLAGQVALKFNHLTACTSGDPNCVCSGTTCTKNVFTSTGQTLFTVSSTASGVAEVQACFSDAEDQTHADDCAETETSPTPTTLLSNVLTVEAIPVNLTSGTFQLVAPSPAQEPAFSYPGAQFEAYGTFTALTGTPFNDGASATGTQRLTRLVGWTTRKEGSTTESSDIAFVRRTSDGLFNDIGQMAYSKDVTESTVVDVSFTAPSVFSASTGLPDPVPFTICPSTGCP